MVTAAAEAGDLEADQLKTLQSFVAELEEQLNEANLLRLSVFTRFASDEAQSKLERLAYALSGWYLGSVEATNNFGLAESLPVTRALIREYLNTADANRRDAILSELRTMETGTPQFLALIIANMNPPKTVASVPTDRPMQFEVQAALPKGETRQAPYLIQLPPEYDPQRKYPCILALPTAQQSPQEAIDWWCGKYLDNLKVHSGPASRHGYIVISPKWYGRGQTDYGYTLTEHDIVLGSYRSAIKRFSIDTDRVFLAGHFRGGDAAWDIGLAHPDLWAGVITVSAVADKYVKYYYRNAGFQNLPFYQVIGDRDLGVRTESSITTLNYWLSSGPFRLDAGRVYGARKRTFLRRH